MIDMNNEFDSQNKMKKKQSISLVIPIYNALDDVKMCLNSIVENFDFEFGNVVLVNDKSQEETSAYLNEFVETHQKFILLNNSENLGFVKTCNKGMKEATGNIIVLLNSDTKLPKHFNEKVSNCFNSDENIGVASPITSSSWLYNIPMKKNLSLDEMNSLLQTIHKAEYPLIPSAEGFCFCIRREVIENIGGLDEVYGRGYHEEVDFSYRAIKAGFKVALIDDLYVYHKAHASFGKKGGDKLIHENNRIFRERWGSFRKDYEKQINFVNPIYAIRRKIYPLRYWFFAKEKTYKTKVIRIFGLNFKFKRG